MKPPAVFRLGESVDPFSLTTLDGKTIRFPEDFRGRKVLLDFCSTNVRLSRNAMPVLKKMKSDLSGAGFTIVSAYLERPGDPTASERVKKAVANLGLDWDVTFDAKSWSAALPEKYAIAWAPTRVLLDGDTATILARPQDLQNPDLVPAVCKALNVAVPEDLQGALVVKEPVGVAEPKVAKEIIQRWDYDQAVRELSFAGAPIKDHLRVFDSINSQFTRWIKDVVHQIGWPTPDKVGKEASAKAWLFVEHADDDRDFQRECLPLIREAYSKKLIDGSNLAYLTDRTELAAGRDQIYGTHLTSVGGQMQALPVVDPKNVDKLRAEMGMPSLKEFLDGLNKFLHKTGA